MAPLYVDDPKRGSRRAPREGRIQSKQPRIFSPTHKNFGSVLTRERNYMYCAIVHAKTELRRRGAPDPRMNRQTMRDRGGGRGEEEEES